MALTDRRDPAEVIVTVRHRCPDFAFGSALGPYGMVSYWWRHGANNIAVATDSFESRPAILAAIRACLAGTADLRRHLDERAELPDVP